MSTPLKFKEKEKFVDSYLRYDVFYTKEESSVYFTLKENGRVECVLRTDISEMPPMAYPMHTFHGTIIPAKTTPSYRYTRVTVFDKEMDKLMELELGNADLFGVIAKRVDGDPSSAFLGSVIGPTVVIADGIVKQGFILDQKTQKGITALNRIESEIDRYFEDFDEKLRVEKLSEVRRN